MQGASEPGRRILVSGSTGLLGRAIVAQRQAAGDHVVPLVRGEAPGDAVRWDPLHGLLDPAAVSGFDAVIHLAGEPVANARWTAGKKRRILDSRVAGTRTLATALAAAPQPPRVFVCASGINFYGDSGDRVIDEAVPAGSGFLSEVCVGWEAATAPLAPLARVVNLRIGVVLAAYGGTLAAMLPLFRLGLGGSVGGGHAYLSWIALEDVVRAIDHVIASAALHGPVNLVAPEPVTGREFTAALAAAVGKPAVLPVPAWAVRLLLGQMAEETVLASVRAVPRRLLDDGFGFNYPELTEALAACRLGKRGSLGKS